MYLNECIVIIHCYSYLKCANGSGQLFRALRILKIMSYQQSIYLKSGYIYIQVAFILIYCYLIGNQLLIQYVSFLDMQMHT